MFRSSDLEFHARLQERSAVHLESCWRLSNVSQRDVHKLGVDLGMGFVLHYIQQEMLEEMKLSLRELGSVSIASNLSTLSCTTPYDRRFSA